MTRSLHVSIPAFRIAVLAAEAVLLFGCAAAKMQPEERFLSLNPEENKIVILSVIPAQGDSSGTYLSSLIFNQAGEQATASVETYVPDPLRYTRHDYFAQGLNYFDTSHFPVIAKTLTSNDLENAFSFSLYRHSVDFSAGSGNSYIHYELTFEKQVPFRTQAVRTDYRIGGIEPLDVTFKKLNDGTAHNIFADKLMKPSVMLYHTLENADALFAPPGKTFYWIDFYKFGETGYSCFFEKDASGVTKVLYSTLPAGEQLDALLYYTTDNSGVLLVGLNSLLSDERLMIVPFDGQPLPVRRKDHTVKTVIVTENNEPVGAGILYQL